MGFETREEAERFAEAAEFRADQLREERLLKSAIPDPKEMAWQRLIALPAYSSMTDSAKELQRAVFDYAWDAAMRSQP